MSINLIDPESSNIYTNRIFKRTLKNDIVNKWVEKNVNKWLRRRVENALVLPPGVNVDLPTWAIESQKHGKSLHRFILSNSSESILKHINDLFLDLIRYSSDDNKELSLYSEKILSSITHYGVEDLFDMANDFYDKMADLAGPQAASRSRNEVFAVSRYDGEEVIVSVSDGNYAWRQVVPRGLKTVAVKLRNCLGGRQYAQGIRSGNEEIWVLVKPDSDGKFNDIDNICVAMQIGLKERHVIEVKGAGNSTPFEYSKEISEFCVQKSVKDPDIKNRYISSSQALEETCQKIKTRGQWELWVEMVGSPTRQHILGKKIYIKKNDDSRFDNAVGIFEYTEKYVTPTHKDKTECVTLHKEITDYLSDRDSHLLINDIGKILLSENQKNNIIFSSFYSRPIVEFLSLDAHEFQLKNPTDYSRYYSICVASNSEPWHDRVIFQKTLGDLSFHVLNDGGVVVEGVYQENNFLNFIPPTSYTKKVAEYLSEANFDFPVDFVKWKSFESKALIGMDKSSDVLNTWNKTIFNNQNVYFNDFNDISYFMSKLDDSAEVFDVLLNIDPTGDLMSGNLVQIISKNSSEIKYVSPIFGVIPNNIIISDNGILNYDEIPKTSHESGVDFSEVNYKTLFHKDQKLKALLVKNDDSYKIVAGHCVQRPRRGIPQYDEDNNSLRLLVDSYNYTGTLNSKYLGDLKYLRFLNDKCHDFEGFNNLKLTPNNILSDVFPMPFLKDNNFFDKKRRNLGSDKYPIIKTSNPNRYFGVDVSRDGDIENGTVVWMGSVNSDKELRIYHICSNGVEHLSNSLNYKSWSVSSDFNNDLRDFFQKSGYSVYRGRLLSASNTSLDNFVDGKHKILRNYSYSGVNMEPGDDRSWEIKLSKDGNYGLKEFDSFWVSASSVKSDNGLSIAHISNKMSSYLINSVSEEEILNSRKMIVKIVNEASMEISDFDSLWLGIKRLEDGKYHIEREENEYFLDLDNNYYIKSDIHSDSATFRVFKSDIETKKPEVIIKCDNIHFINTKSMPVDLLNSIMILRQNIADYSCNININTISL